MGKISGCFESLTTFKKTFKNARQTVETFKDVRIKFLKIFVKLKKNFKGVGGVFQKFYIADPFSTKSQQMHLKPKKFFLQVITYFSI